MEVLSIIILLGVILLTLLWFVGSGWATMITEGAFACTGWGLIIGFCINIIIVCLANFLGFPSGQYWLPTLCIIIFLGCAGWGLRVKYGGSKNGSVLHSLYAPLLVLAVYLVFSSPLYVKYKQLSSIIYYSGDYMTYWSHAHWLVNHSISQKPVAASLISPIAAYFYDYQTKGLRISSQTWLAFLDSMMHFEPEQLFTLLSGFMLGLQALAAAIIMFRLRPKQLWAALIVGLLFGLHPFLVWDGYAAFLPQMTGFVFVMAILAVMSFDECLRQPIRAGALLGLMFAALFVSYAEMMPVIGVLCAGLYLTRILRKKADWRSFGGLLFGFVITFGILSAIDFTYFWHGLIFQIQTNGAYGGEQSTNPLVVLGLWLGSIRAPVEPTLIGQLTHFHFEIIWTAIITAVVAFSYGWKNLKELRWASSICFLMFALLFAFITHRYAGIALSWNIFKLTNYAVPLLYIWVLLAMFVRPNALIIMLYLVTWGCGQVQLWKSVYHDSTVINTSLSDQRQHEANARRAFIQRLPSNAGLYIGTLPTYLERFSLYSMLADRHFTTIYDNLDFSRIFCPDANKAVPLSIAHDLLVSQPLFRYVICSPCDTLLYRGKVIYRDSSYVILELMESTILPVSQQYSDGNHEIFMISRKPGQNKMPVTFLSSQPQALDIVITCSDIDDPTSLHQQISVSSPFTEEEIDCSSLQSLNLYMHVWHHGFIEVLNGRLSTNNQYFSKLVEQPIDLTQWHKILPLFSCSAEAKINTHSVKFLTFKPSSGWLRLDTEMMPGLYYYEIRTGVINVGGVISTASRPFFFGQENDNYHTLNLTPYDSDAVRWYPFVVNEKEHRSFYTGIGAWGIATGKAEINSLRLFKVE